MRYSKLFGKTSKSAPADAESTNAKLLAQGGFVAKQMAGVYNYLPLGLRVLGKIQNIIREEMNAIGGQEILMPALTQEESYIKTGRSDMDVLFHLTGQGDSKLVLNPTHEEVVTPLVQSYTFSYRDLPIFVYQIQNKFRNEARAKSGVLRGREFSMKDLYSFHTTPEDLDSFYDKVIPAYFKIYERLGIRDYTLLTFASGGSFSKYSHEFQAICPVGEDTIFVCEKCKQAVNKEIIQDQSSCPQCGNSALVEKRSIEVGNIFKLQSKYTAPFNFTYKDASGKENLVLMGCYGIGPSRTMGTVVELFHDEKGIIWPESIAPYRVHLIALGPDENALKEAENMYEELVKSGVEVLYDDRADVSAGEKFKDADLIGIPLRIVMSKKTLAQNGFELKRRNEDKAEIIPISKLSTVVK